MVKTTIYLPDEVHKSLREKAFKNTTSITQLILKALKSQGSVSVARHPHKVKEASPTLAPATVFCKHGSLPELCKHSECRKT